MSHTSYSSRPNANFKLKLCSKLFKFPMKIKTRSTRLKMRTLIDLFLTALNDHSDILFINSATTKICIRQVRRTCYVGHGFMFSTRRYLNNGRWNSSHFTPLFGRTENNYFNLLKIKYVSRNKIITLFENFIVLYYSKKVMFENQNL